MTSSDRSELPVLPSPGGGEGGRLRQGATVVCLLALAVTVSTAIWLVGERVLDGLDGHAVPGVFSIRVLLAHLSGGVVWAACAFSVIRIRRQSRSGCHDPGPSFAAIVVTVMLLVTGLALFYVPASSTAGHRPLLHWLHGLLPLLVAGAAIRRRQRSLDTRRTGMHTLVVAVAVCCGVLGLLRLSESAGPSDFPSAATALFSPSMASTPSGRTIPARLLDRSDDCLECHAEVHAGWHESAHHFSSFNNPAYLASFLETQRVLRERDGDSSAIRWCAGCHDPVPLLSGHLEDDEFDPLTDPVADAGITCTVCHAITEVAHTQGNGGYTIEEPELYPFADSEQSLLRWMNHQLIKVRPAAHQHTYLKEVHSRAEFCSACHKVHIPEVLTEYRAFLRGQNHYDSWLLSGVSGHSARSFYYPETAEQNCSGCHMPESPSANDADAGNLTSGSARVRDHLFPAANTALPWLRGSSETVADHQSFLQGTVGVDVFGIRDGSGIDSPLVAPLRPQPFTVQPGNSYLLETVIRTIDIGHHFTQGTSDSNQVWLEVTVSSGGEMIAASGLTDEDSAVDPQAHFVNSFLLDRRGRRIDRRNVQDIFVALYDHQIPPGAAQTVHYRLHVPADIRQAITVTARLLYRKFDTHYVEFIADTMDRLNRPLSNLSSSDGNPLPVTLLAEDSVTLAVKGADAVVSDTGSPDPEWRRWNDYGIGLLLKGPAELRQAADAFRHVESLGRYDGPLNLARTLLAEGGDVPLAQAADAVQRATTLRPAAPEWTVDWLRGAISRQQGDLDTAEAAFRRVLTLNTEETRRRGFDFSRDYVVNNLLGRTVFDQAMRLSIEDGHSQRLREAVDIFQRTLLEDSENIDAHHNLAQLYQLLGNEERAAEHRAWHARYRPDDTARGRAVEAARRRYPHADAASEPVMIYRLQPAAESTH